MFKRFNKMQFINILAFLIVPLISSFISTYHIVGFFELGNYTWMAILLAVAFELGALASALSITILDKISKAAVWSIFIMLVTFQIIGNVYYTFDFILAAEQSKSGWLDTATKFIEYWYEFDTLDEMKMFLAILIGIPIPLMSLGFLKTLTDYVSTLDKESSVEDVSKEDVESEEKKEDVVDAKETEDVVEELDLEVGIEEGLSEQEIEYLIENIENPPEPNESLAKAKDEYDAIVSDISEIDNMKSEIETHFEITNEDKMIDILSGIVEDTYVQAYGKPYDIEKLKNKFDVSTDKKKIINELLHIVKDTYVQAYGKPYDIEKLKNKYKIK